MVNFSAIIDFIKSDLRTISGSKEKPQRTLLSFFETVSNYDPQNDVPELEKLEQAVNEAHKGGEDSKQPVINWLCLKNTVMSLFN